MVRTGSQKYEKGQYVFVFWGCNVDALLLTAWFFMFMCLERFPKRDFGLSKSIYVPNLIRNEHSDICDFFWFLVFSSFIFHIFDSNSNLSNLVSISWSRLRNPSCGFIFLAKILKPLKLLVSCIAHDLNFEGSAFADYPQLVDGDDVAKVHTDFNKKEKYYEKGTKPCSLERRKYFILIFDNDWSKMWKMTIRPKSL